MAITAESGENRPMAAKREVPRAPTRRYILVIDVGGGVDTVSGGIELGPNASVDGGLHVHDNHSLLSSLSGNVPRIVVGPRSRVGGTLNFERKVLLYVSDQATIGPVQGATVVKYSGERPPD